MRKEKGQSLVETALILPIILLLIFGITDFGRIFHAYLTMDHAGREAARVASIGKEESIVLTKIAEATNTLDQAKLFKDVTYTGTDDIEVTITLEYPVDFLTPIIRQVIGTFDLENKTVMRVE